MKGKSVRRRLEPVVIDYVEIPKEILSNVMFFNKLVFLSSIINWMKSTTIYYTPNRSEKE